MSSNVLNHLQHSFFAPVSCDRTPGTQTQGVAHGRLLGLVAALGCLLLASCTGVRMDAPVNVEWEERRQVLASLSHWEFTGSVNVRDAREAHSSRIRWHQDGDHYRINLWGTFNAGATQIDGRPGEVSITQRDQPPVITHSPEELLYQELGYELPVSELNHWVKGIPAPGLPSQLEFGDNHQLLRFEQAGWQINYLGFTNFGTETLPTRIRVERVQDDPEDLLRLDLTRLSWSLAPERLIPEPLIPQGALIPQGPVISEGPFIAQDVSPTPLTPPDRR